MDVYVPSCADDTSAVVGLEKDYTTLSNRPNKDGYLQFLVNLFSASVGGDVIGGNISMSFHQVKSHDVCVINVAPSPRPIWIEDGILRKVLC